MISVSFYAESSKFPPSGLVMSYHYSLPFEQSIFSFHCPLIQKSYTGLSALFRYLEVFHSGLP